MPHKICLCNAGNCLLYSFLYLFIITTLPIDTSDFLSKKRPKLLVNIDPYLVTGCYSVII